MKLQLKSNILILISTRFGLPINHPYPKTWGERMREKNILFIYSGQGNTEESCGNEQGGAHFFVNSSISFCTVGQFLVVSK